MNTALSVLADIDRICGQFAAAMQQSEMQIYATVALLLIVGVFLFPPRNDPDQV